MQRSVNEDVIEAKHIEFPLAIKAIGEDGSFAGYASIFDVVDNHKDIIVRGAFERTLREREGDQSIKLLWQHRADEPIGFFTEIREDNRGLFVEGCLLLEVQRAREAHALLKSGAIDGLSIGYTANSFDIEPETGVRILRDVDLWEISLVTFPANPQAQITHVKQELPHTVREFEHFLRDAGFSRKQAKAISAHGFLQTPKQRDAVDSKELAALIDAFDSAIGVLVNN